MQFVLVPGGSFVMKDTMGFPGVMKPGVTTVRLNDFFIGRYEVTQAEWERVMGENPSPVRGSRWPVQGISWPEAEEFARRLSGATGERFRLPTEAEWEYAARDRGGEEPWPGTADGSRIGEYAWHGKNSGGLPHRVGSRKPNGLGLFDMAGNVREWCRDLFGPYPDSTRENPAGVAEGKQRAVRGGSWSTDRLRAPDRDSEDPSRREVDVGLRLVREAPIP
jgi:formylglycine-generating enzyme required for sulfatase activity